MTEKRFTYDKPLVAFSKGGINDNVTGETYEFTMNTVLDLLNELHEENQKQKTTIRMLEQQSQRQINRNDRLHKDWDKLYQHILDMGLMTHEEILKVIE